MRGMCVHTLLLALTWNMKEKDNSIIRNSQDKWTWKCFLTATCTLMDALVAKKGPFRWVATSVLKGYLGILHVLCMPQVLRPSCLLNSMPVLCSHLKYLLFTKYSKTFIYYLTITTNHWYVLSSLHYMWSEIITSLF